MTQLYYPTSHPARLNEDLRLVYDQSYQNSDRLSTLEHKVGEMTKPAPAAPSPSGPSNTKLTGIGVKAVPPGHGTSPFYNQTSGQFEYQTPAGAVAAPASSSATGQPGQIAFDSGFVYICIGVNSWARAALSTF